MIGVIDYGMGNLRSVLNALEHLGHAGRLVSSPEEAAHADRLILPGVGAFGEGMRELAARGFAGELEGLVEAGRPLLGICLGMQLLASRGTEYGDHAGLGLIPGVVREIETDPGLRIPHVGWNTLERVRPSPLFEGLHEEPSFYFVHSYEFRPGDEEAVTARTPYGASLTACVGRGHVHGVQFHPEKSQRDGLRLLESFVAL